MIKAMTALPEGYGQYLTIDLQNNKKSALFVNGLAILIGFVMAVPMHFRIPISTLFGSDQELSHDLLRLAVLVAGMAAYMVLHEVVHGIAMKLCGTRKVKYGFTGLYAFAGSDDYYGKAAYTLIALAPIVVWGVVLLILNLSVPAEWFWVIYWIQIVNISGAAGDLYVTVRFLKLPKDILIRDAGTSMLVYLKD